ncbi:MAG: hypothetical protein ACREID_00855 [Planctomycetota bacterium]
MARISDQVRHLVGLENLLQKARRRHRECEREEGGPEGPKGARYGALVGRLGDEIHSVDRKDLEEYLAYLEGSMLKRIAERVERAKKRMVELGKELVDAKSEIHELRVENTDALDRVRSVRERLGMDPFRPMEVHFGFPPQTTPADRRARDAYDLVREFLRS